MEDKLSFKVANMQTLASFVYSKHVLHLLYYLGNSTNAFRGSQNLKGERRHNTRADYIYIYINIQHTVGSGLLAWSSATQCR